MTWSKLEFHACQHELDYSINSFRKTTKWHVALIKLSLQKSEIVKQHVDFLWLTWKKRKMAKKWINSLATKNRFCRSRNNKTYICRRFKELSPQQCFLNEIPNENFIRFLLNNRRCYLRPETKHRDIRNRSYEHASTIKCFANRGQFIVQSIRNLMLNKENAQMSLKHK